MITTNRVAKKTRTFSDESAIPLFPRVTKAAIAATNSWRGRNTVKSTAASDRFAKFKTMNDKKDVNGELLPDAERLTKIGLIVRKTSLDEIPQLINVF